MYTAREINTVSRRECYLVFGFSLAFNARIEKRLDSFAFKFRVNIRLAIFVFLPRDFTSLASAEELETRS